MPKSLEEIPFPSVFNTTNDIHKFIRRWFATPSTKEFGVLMPKELLYIINRYFDYLDIHWNKGQDSYGNRLQVAIRVGQGEYEILSGLYTLSSNRVQSLAQEFVVPISSLQIVLDPTGFMATIPNFIQGGTRAIYGGFNKVESFQEIHEIIKKRQESIGIT